MLSVSRFVYHPKQQYIPCISYSRLHSECICTEQALCNVGVMAVCFRISSVSDSVHVLIPCEFELVFHFESEFAINQGMALWERGARRLFINRLRRPLTWGQGSKHEQLAVVVSTVAQSQRYGM